MASGLLGHGVSDVDEIISDDAEPHPSLHPIVFFIAASVQPVPAFEQANSSFTTSPPFLPFLEPASLLMLAPSPTLG
jgi:hypothetical protein